MVTLDTTKEYVLEQDGSFTKNVRFNLIDGFENDVYTIMLEMSNVNIVNPNGSWVVYINTSSEIDSGADNKTIKSFIKNGKVSFTYKPSRQQKTMNWFNICLHTDSGVGSTITIKNVVVLKGDHTQEDIPYFEGMQSVRMPVLTTTNEDGTKTNILTVNEEVELRGIGDVQDTLDLITGELTERIGEVVLDGSEDWVLQTTPTDVRNAIYRLSISDISTSISNTKTNCISDKAKSGSWADILNTKTDKTFAILQNQQLRVKFDGTVEELKEWLKETTLTVKYIKEKVVKTVDLKTINESGESVYFMPLEGTMHVSCTSETIQPTFDMSVPVEATTQNLASFINLEMEG